jgi:hypothetical protein
MRVTAIGWLFLVLVVITTVAASIFAGEQLVPRSHRTVSSHTAIPSIAFA